MAIFFPALSRLVDTLRAAGRATDAVAAARAGLAKAPASARHLALLGEALLAARDARGAEAALGQALALAPDAAPVRIDLARAQIAQGRAKDAEATLAPVPDSVERTLLLGAAASTDGRWTEAAARYEAFAFERTFECLRIITGASLRALARLRPSADPTRRPSGAVIITYTIGFSMLIWSANEMRQSRAPSCSLAS